MDDQIKNEKSFRLVTRIGTIRKYCSLYGALWQNSVMRDMQFKMNFLLWIFVEFLWFGLQLAFVAVIYSHTDRIATWSKWEVVLLTGGSQFIQQVFHAIFLNNIVGLSEHIRTGRLDFMLLLPINSRFLISLRTVDLGSLVGALGGGSLADALGKKKAMILMQALWVLMLIQLYCQPRNKTQSLLCAHTHIDLNKCIM